jgi:hypothetical protein
MAFTVSRYTSSAPGFRWTSRWDIICVQTQEPTPISNTSNSSEHGRFSSQRKTATVLRLRGGGDLVLVSRELGVTAATLSGRRDDFLAGGQAALKSRPADDRDDEIARLRAKDNLLWIRTFATVAELVEALREFRLRYN